MKKRSAILMAAGLVVALLSAAVAMTIGLSGNGAAEAGGRAKKDPIVRTIKRTVTVHRDAKATDQASVQVVRLDPSSSTTSDTSVSESDDDDSYGSSDSYGSEDSYEGEDSYGSEDSYEGEDSYGSEDHSSDGSSDQSSDDPSSQSGSEDEHEDD